MNKQIITLVVVAVAAMAVGYFIGTGTSSGVKPESQITMKNQTDSLNYFLGLNWGYSLEEAPWEADADLLASGIVQVLTDSSSFDPMTAQNIFRDLSMALSEIEQKRAEEDSFQTLEDGVAFLEENGRKDGVTTTESGLQYEVVTLGDGPMPTEASRVYVFYEGTLLDGTVFDGNFDTGDTIDFLLNGVIPGWTEGLQLMPVGSTYKFYIPSNLAYGSRDSGPIPANSTLIFKVELLEVK
ncbi:MAG: peptidylprolyl isomerase [Bacteroidetes bacterium]|nr:MAG: peptidylprolyl isomerase [Bacteroidota bacterium]RLD90920.1 MAG: peptidylprolyl isomerase [Bacteroidota bacterium]